MKKATDKILLTLSPPLRKEVKKAAKEADVTETAFIREAIKSRLRNPPEDPLHWLQPEKEDFILSCSGQNVAFNGSPTLCFRRSACNT